MILERFRSIFIKCNIVALRSLTYYKIYLFFLFDDVPSSRRPVSTPDEVGEPDWLSGWALPPPAARAGGDVSPVRVFIRHR
jgi:hypothetical protein